MNKVIITVLGKDSVGIIAKVCTHLAAERINVLDINQTIVQDYFHMMMIVDISAPRRASRNSWMRCRNSARKWGFGFMYSGKKFSKPCTAFKGEAPC